VKVGGSKNEGYNGLTMAHVLAAVRRLNRLELLGETLRAALNAVAEEDPDWLQAWVPVDWFERYSRRIEEWRIPSAKQKQDLIMQQIGQDGSRLLTQIWSEQGRTDLHQPGRSGKAPPYLDAAVFPRTRKVSFRCATRDDLPPAHLTIRSPYDAEAHYGHKRDLSWYGDTGSL
jgi:transposase